jgi:hypothetical protein
LTCGFGLCSVSGESGAEGEDERLANRSRSATPAAEPQTELLKENPGFRADWNWIKSRFDVKKYQSETFAIKPSTISATAFPSVTITSQTQWNWIGPIVRPVSVCLV